MAAHSSTLAWEKSHGRRSLVGCSPWGRTKSQTRLSDFTFTFHFHAWEKELASHSSVLAWRIPGTAEPGGLPSMGSHRVGHDWSDLAAAAAIITTVHILFVLTFFSLWHSNYMPLTLLEIVLQLLNVIFWFSCLPFFLFAFHVANFLLTYIQAHWFFFFQSCWVYWWAHQRYSSFLLHCFLFFLMILCSSLHLSTYIIPTFLDIIDFLH